MSGRLLFHGYFINGERDLEAILKPVNPDSNRTLVSSCECDLDNETEKSQKGLEEKSNKRVRGVGRKTFSYLKQISNATRAVVRRLSLTSSRTSLSSHTNQMNTIDS